MRAAVGEPVWPRARSWAAGSAPGMSGAAGRGRGPGCGCSDRDQGVRGGREHELWERCWRAGWWPSPGSIRRRLWPSWGPIPIQRALLRAVAGVGAGPRRRRAGRPLRAGNGLRFLRVSEPQAGAAGASGGATRHPLRATCPSRGLRAARADPVERLCTRGGGLHPGRGLRPPVLGQVCTRFGGLHLGRGLVGPDRSDSAPAPGADPRTGCSRGPDRSDSAPAPGADPRTGCSRAPHGGLRPPPQRDALGEGASTGGAPRPARSTRTHGSPQHSRFR